VSDSPHRIVNPEALPPPTGFAHAAMPADGQVVHLGGQAGHRTDGSIADDLVEQFDQACANVVEALRGAGGEPGHLVALQIFATNLGEYRDRLPQLGEVWRRHFGKHYPAMALLGTTELFDPRAKVELVGTAVVPS
jgi:enamine deaminase RidA (YjgF/YER057c/UK114 family)